VSRPKRSALETAVRALSDQDLRAEYESVSRHTDQAFDSGCLRIRFACMDEATRRRIRLSHTVPTVKGIK
jgi:preprotein translocase subunit SecA